MIRHINISLILAQTPTFRSCLKSSAIITVSTNQSECSTFTNPAAALQKLQQILFGLAIYEQEMCKTEIFLREKVLLMQHSTHRRTHTEIHIKSIPMIRSYPALSLEKVRDNIVGKKYL